MPIYGREAATTFSLPLPWKVLDALYLAMLWKQKGKEAQRPREEIAPVCLPCEGESWSAWPWESQGFPPHAKKPFVSGSDLFLVVQTMGRAEGCLCRIVSQGCVGMQHSSRASQPGHGLCPSIPLPFTPSSLKIVLVSINAVEGKVKCLRAAELKTVRKGSGHLKRKTSNFPSLQI